MTRSNSYQPDPRLDLVLERIVDVPRELVWTVVLAPGYRPSNEQSEVPSFTAVITLEAHGKGTKYTALAMHKDEEGRQAHEEMGFHMGWGKALDQLVATAKAM